MVARKKKEGGVRMLYEVGGKEGEVCEAKYER